MNDDHSEYLWWERKGLCYEKNSLAFAGKDLHQLAHEFGTPSFVYSTTQIRQNLEKIRTALGQTGLDFSLYYAMKANRFAPLLTFIKSTGLCGIDACSPEEVLHARACGFKAGEISYTANSVSPKDLDTVLRQEGIIINCDSITMIRKIGECCPGREIGIRLNPSMGVGYGSVELLRYSGDKTSKFGIYAEQFDEAVETAKKYDLRIVRIHFHTGCGYLSSQLDAWDKIIQTCLEMAGSLKDLTSVNLGGGLGVPHTRHDKPLDLDAWASIVARNFKGKGLRVELEPGDFIAKTGGILLLEVNTVEKKRATTFVGLNGGLNLAVEPFYYSLPCEPVLCRFTGDKHAVFKKENLKPYSVCGNINEALDVWAENHFLPEVHEGDILAMINAGGYASSMSSNHCMRGVFREFLLPE
jgi:diaminopimelate decarboxylase